MKPVVSIILTSYNKPNTVGKSIESVLAQTFTHWELFIMDDASNEETTTKIKSYLHDERIHYYNSQIENKNRYKTTRYATLINTAIPKTKGEFLTYLTDDTMYVPKRLELMMQVFNHNSVIEAVYSGQKVIHVDENLDVLTERTRMTKGTLQEAANIVDHCSVMHTRKIADQVFQTYGSFWNDDPKYWHNADAAFWSRVNTFTSFHPIEEILDISYKTPYSFQNLNANLPEHLPEGTIVKGQSSNVYVIEESRRREIDREWFPVLLYRSRDIVEIPDPILFKYSLGPKIDETVFSNPSLFPNGRLVKAKESTTIYYIENHQKRLIDGFKAFKKFKFQKKNIIPLTYEFLEGFELGPPIHSSITEHTILPSQLLFKDFSSYYLSNQNQLHPIEKNSVKKLNLKEQQAIRLSKKEKKLFTEGTPFCWTYFQK
ncbi:glycosyltransferase family A protein [Alkalihalobacterium bogoriense]|uniref:glycosyltransferase family A protein n=1 Tax=Alkalihalobacterium bogoriense TaxID=246272 RepID=UPI00047C6E3B|nr:glycosyltransferase family A protein [Alkalihalobacterium bogoriense]